MVCIHETITTICALDWVCDLWEGFKQIKTYVKKDLESVFPFTQNMINLNKNFKYADHQERWPGKIEAEYFILILNYIGSKYVVEKRTSRNTEM